MGLPACWCPCYASLEGAILQGVKGGCWAKRGQTLAQDYRKARAGKVANSLCVLACMSEKERVTT
eukprot:1141438-Pelagomonas_calceolata.AAC.4